MNRPRRADIRVFRNAEGLHDWLKDHHATEAELWVGFYKKGVPKESIAYPEAVDEGLCFGWIDGITYRIDDELYTIRFTPRTKSSNWSAMNVRRVGELTAAGRMHPAGLAAFEARRQNGTGIYSYENRPRELPKGYAARLRADDDAWTWWQEQTPSYRRAATWWVISAKQETTRGRRLEQLIVDSAAGRPVKPLASERKTVAES